MTLGGGPSLEALRIDVTGDDKGAQETFTDVQKGIGQTEQTAAKATGTLSELGKEMGTAGQSAGQLTTQISGLRGRLEELNQLRSMTGPSVAGQIDQAIHQTEAELASAQRALDALKTTTKAAGDAAGETGQKHAEMARHFTDSVRSVDQLREHLESLSKQQESGRASGIFMPGVQQEINRTAQAIKELTGAGEEGGHRFSAGFGPVREAVSGVTEEVMRMLGVTVPGMSNMVGVAAGVGEKFDEVEGIAGGLSLGLLGVAAAAVTVGVSATVMGAEWQKTNVILSNAAEISEKAAQEIGGGLQTLSTGTAASARAMSDSLAGVAMRWEQFRGESLGVTESVTLMRTAEELAAAANDRLDVSTRTLVGTMISGKVPVADLAHQSDILFNISRVTGTGLSELGTQIERTTARMGDAAPTTRDMGVALDLLAQSGNIGSRSMMQATSMLAQLANPSKEARATLKDLNVELEYTADGHLNLLKLVEDLSGVFGGIENQEYKNAIATRLVGAEYGLLEQMLSRARTGMDAATEAIDKQGTAHEAAERRAKTLEEQMGMLGHRAEVFGQNVGSQIVPVLLLFGENINNIVLGVGQLSSNIGRAVSDLEGLRTGIQNFAGMSVTVPVHLKVDVNGKEVPEGETPDQRNLRIAREMWGGNLPGQTSISPVTVPIRPEMETSIGPNDPSMKAGGPGNLSELESAYAKVRTLREREAGAQTTEQQQQAEAARRAEADALNASQAGWESARRASQAFTELGSEGQKLQPQIEEFIKHGFEQGGAGARNAINQIEADIDNSWAKALDPGKAKERSARFQAALDEMVRAQGAGETEKAKAAGDQALELLRGFHLEDIEAEQNKRVEAERKRAAADAKREQEEALRALKATAEYGFSQEQFKQGITESWGKLGSDSILALTEAIADPAHMAQSGSALSRSIGNLTKLLRESGVPEWQQLGIDLGDAGLMALRGEMEPGRFQELLRGTIAQLPKLNLATVFGGDLSTGAILAGDLPGQLRTLGTEMLRDITEGFSTTKQVESFQSAIGGALKMTEKLTDQGKADDYVTELLTHLNTVMTDRTPEAVNDFQEWMASWARALNIDVVTAEANAKIDKAQEAMREHISKAGTEERRAVFNALESAYAERGTAVPIESVKDRVMTLMGGSSMAEMIQEISDPGKTAETLAVMTNQLISQIDSATGQLANAYGVGLRKERQTLQEHGDQMVQTLRENQKRESEELQQIQERRRRGTEDQRTDQDAQLARQRQAAAEQRALALELRHAAESHAGPEQLAAIHQRFQEQQTEQQIRQHEEDADRTRDRGRRAADLTQREADKRETDALSLRQAAEAKSTERENQRSQQALQDRQAEIALAKQLVDMAVRNQTATHDAAVTYDKVVKEQHTVIDKLHETPPWLPVLQAVVDQLRAGVTAAEPTGTPPFPIDYGTLAGRGRNTTDQAFGLGRNGDQRPIPVYFAQEDIDRIVDALASRPIVIPADQLETVLEQQRATESRYRSVVGA